MRRTIKLLLPTNPAIFQPTVEAYTKAYNYICKYGYENKQFNNINLHYETYKDVRDLFNLPAQLATAARVKAYGTLKASKPKIKSKKCKVPVSKQIAIQYTKNRSYSINLEKKIISISTLQGRVKLPLPFIPKHFLKYLSWNVKGAEVLIKNNKVYLNLSVEKDTPETIPTTQIVGLDRGINNLAVLSNNKFYSGKQVKVKTQKIRKLKSKLQSVGSKSAKRHLRKINQKENRFRKDVNHQISKKIINDLSRGSVLVLEDLNIKTKKKLGKTFNKKLGSWAWFQLEQFLIYKAEEKQIKIVKVDPAYTSQKCSKCGHTEKRNRSGSNFCCCSCGFQLNADLNASRNIQRNFVPQEQIQQSWLNDQRSESRAAQSTSLLSRSTIRDKPATLVAR